MHQNTSFTEDSLHEMDFKDIIATIQCQDYLQNLTSSLALNQSFAKKYFIKTFTQNAS